MEPGDPGTVRMLRIEIRDFLSRHAHDSADLWAAELAVAELLANAFEHGGGGAWVSLDWASRQPVLTVHDLGPLFRLDAVAPRLDAHRGRGLWMVSQVTRDLQVAAKRAGGKQVSVTLPVSRLIEDSFDPPGRSVNPLPAADEATADGFTREPFLRALVVELSRAVEEQHGPLAAEAAVARVGATVGGQMEEEFRRVRAIVGRLTPEQIMDCYIRLKAGIDGDFYAVEVGPDRIVLGNRRCPFGDAVRHSPSLCRMTSSVFGGIAARNNGAATVILNERIAVGDPECRVTVLLGPRVTDENSIGHRYLVDTPTA